MLEHLPSCTGRTSRWQPGVHAHANLKMLMPTNVLLHALDIGSVVDLLAGHQILRVCRVCAWVALTELIVVVPRHHGVPGSAEEGIEAGLNSRRTFSLRLLVLMWVLGIIFDATDHTEVCPLTWQQDIQGGDQ